MGRRIRSSGTYHVSERPDVMTDIEFKEDELTVAAYNVENFSTNTENTPDEKVAKIAKSFVENMKSPDIITLVEVQDNDGPQRQVTQMHQRAMNV